jgi:biopolymer transport protein ExbB
MNANDGSIDSQILDIMLRAGSRWVLWLLIVLSIIAVAVMIERLWFYLKAHTPKEIISRTLGVMRDKGPAAAAKALGDQTSMTANVLRGCLQRASDGAEAVDEQRVALVEQERQRYERWLAILGTLGNNAPFIGLFGTVLGIIRAFHDLAGSSLQNTDAVMTGIVQALVATGVGLIVALPAVAAYNAAVRHVDRITALTESSAHEVLAYLKAKKPKAG